MPSSGKFVCPKCGTVTSIRQIKANGYACPNRKCVLNERLLVHGEINNSGAISKLFSWILEKGTVLKNRYLVEGLIGKGGFGATYLAKDNKMFDQLRAIKEIPKTFFDEKEDEFLTILNHPAIPKLYERFSIGSMHYSVMEYIEGKDLEELTQKSKGGLPESLVLKLMRQICDVLSYIHSQKVIHRDLKPENILIQKDHSIALIDFGIAKQFVVGQGTRYLARAASNFYSSPEQYRPGKGNTDVKSDIYSLGAILYFTLTGREPIDALSRAVSNDIYPLPRNLNPHISAQTERVIIKAMKMNKKDRYVSIRQMQQALLEKNRKSTKICSKCGKGLENPDNYCPNCGHATKPQKISTVPKIAVHPDSIKLVNIVRGTAKRAVITISNAGFGTLNGQIKSNVKWLVINKAAFRCTEGEKLKILISIKADSLSVKKLHKAALAIQSNGGDKKIPVVINIVEPAPHLQVVPQALNLQLKMGQQASASFLVRNTGNDEKVKARIATPQKWIGIYPKKINEKEKKIKIGISTAKLRAGKHLGRILIKSNWGKFFVPINLEIKAPAKNGSFRGKLSGQDIASQIKPMLIAIAAALLICHFGPNAKPAFSELWFIVFTGIIGTSLGLLRNPGWMFIGLVVGSSLGIITNYVGYFIYQSIQYVMIQPIYNLLAITLTSHSVYAVWGLLGFYFGGFLGLIKCSVDTGKSMKAFLIMLVIFTAINLFLLILVPLMFV